MKKFLFFACMLAVLATGCKKETPTYTISFESNSYNINEKEKLDLRSKLVIEPQSAADTLHISWSSSDESVAYVSQSGVVTGGLDGKATITALSNGKEAKCEVSVTSTPITSYVLGATVASVFLNDVVELPLSNIEPSTAGFAKLQWKSSNANCKPYFVVSEGKWYFKASVVGSVTFIASYEGLEDQACMVPIYVNTIKSITISPVAPVMNVYDTLDMKVTIVKEFEGIPLSYPENLEWSINPGTTGVEDLATIDQNGRVISNSKVGETLIYCKHKVGGPGDKSDFDSVVLMVAKEDPITDFTIDKTSLTINAGESATVNVTSVTPTTSSASQIKWRSEGPTHVGLSTTAGPTCTITTYTDKPGNCIVKAIANGVEKSIAVTVKPVPITDVKITTEAGIAFADGSSEYTFNFSVSPENATITDIKCSTGLDPDKYSVVSVYKNDKYVIVKFNKLSSDTKYSITNLNLTISDGVSEKEAKSSNIYVVNDNIFKLLSPVTPANFYGTFGMEHAIMPLSFVNNPESKIQSNLLIVSPTFDNNEAVQIKNRAVRQNSYSYKDGGLPLQYLMGKIGTEYCSTISFQYAITDMKGFSINSDTQSHKFRNRLTKIEYETRDGSKTVRNETSVGTIITINTQKGNFYYGVNIIKTYMTDYISPSGSPQTGIAKEESYELAPGIGTGKYYDYKGTTVGYSLGNLSWKMHSPSWGVKYN